MKVFWITLITTYILAMLSRTYGKSVTVKGEKIYRSNKFFFISAVVILILVAGLRRGIGDTGTYRNIFESVKPNVMYYFKQFGNLQETGFWVSLAAIKQFVSEDSQVFIFIYALVTITLICIPLYKYSRLSEMSIFLFITMGGYLVVMNGMRQYLAAAILFWAFPWIEERKWYYYIPIVLLASTIHSSAIIMIIFYFIADKKAWGYTTQMLLLVGVGLYLTYSVTGPIIAEVLGETQYGNYSEYLVSGTGGANIIRAFVSVVPLVISFMGRMHLKKNEKYYNIITHGTELYFIFTLLANKYWIYARLNIYFSLYAILLLCWCIKECFEEKSTKIVYGACIILYTIYYWYSMVISMGMQYSSDYIKF